MNQNERYVAAVQKRFHFQIIAKRLGWSENSPEFYYAYRYSLPGQPLSQGRVPVSGGLLQHRVLSPTEPFLENWH